MLFKILFVAISISLSMQVFAKNRGEEICKELMTWTNQQDPRNRTWEVYSQYNAGKLKEVSSDEVKKIHLAFDKVNDSSMPPNLTEAECKTVFKTATGRIAGRGVDLLLKRNDEEEAEPTEQVPEVAVDAIFSSGLGSTVAKSMMGGLMTGAEESGNFCKKSDLYLDQNCFLSVNMMGIPVSFEQIMAYEEQQNAPMPAKYSTADCRCMEKKLEKENKSPATIIKNSPDTAEKLKKVIIKAAGKKFMNDFASYLEDVQFYTTNKAWVLTKNKKNLDYYLCKDPNDFQKAVDDACTKNGTSEGKEARMAELMGAFGDKFNSTGKDLKGGLADLVEDINTYTDVRNVAEDKPNMLTRSQYDPVRYGLSRSQPQVNLVNHLTTAILRDKDMKARLMAHIKNGKTPLYGVMEIMSGKSNTEDTKKIMKILARKHPSLSGKIRGMMDKIGTEEYNKGLGKLFHHALNLHPGLKNILMNPDLFEDVTKVVSKGSKMNSMLYLVEQDKDPITALFISRCNDLKRNFAEAVCTKEDDLLSKVSPKDMDGVLKNQKDFEFKDKEAIDLLICNMNNNVGPGPSAFDGLNVAGINPYSASDYLDRKLHPTEQTNGMANLLSNSNKDPQFAKQLTSLTEKYNHERVTMGAELPSSSHGRGLTSQAMKFVKQNHTVSDSGTSPATSETISPQPGKREPASQSFSATHSQAESSSSTPQNGENMMKPSGQIMPTYSTPQGFMSGTAVAPMAAPILSPSHERLKQSFADNPEKEKYDKLISSINSKDAQELLDFEARVLKEKEKITSSILEEERKKTRSMEEKYEKFEKNHEASGRSFSESGIAQNDNIPSQTFSTGGFVQNSAPTLSDSPVSGSGQMAAGGNFRNVSGESNAVNSALNEVNSKIEGKLIISSSQSTDGQGKGKEDPSGDLISYLKTNEPDGQTLKLLKEAGIIYNFETVDSNGKKVVLQKVVKYADLSPEAKKLVDNKLAAFSFKAMRRAVSIQALRLELMTAALKKSQKI